ncbi:MAG: hypothetical protein KC431_27445, partial [Myxococcales bacterium]|nr:hypothetical protein [Myxococcales bacterium]
LRRAEVGELTARDQRRVSAWLKALDLELLGIELGGSSVRVWLLREAGNTRRGLGAYLIRRGELAPRGDELLLQAPHSFFDKHTGKLALDLFLRTSTAVHGPRALFVNNVHRYRREDGSKGKRTGGDNPADAAHAVDHPLARVSARLLRKRPLQLIQLHGFAAELVDPDAIVSAGTDEPSRASLAVQRGMQRALPELRIAQYGVEADRLGGTGNIQGAAARDARRCFVHVELADRLRERLMEDEQSRARVAVAVLEAAEEEGARGCR